MAHNSADACGARQQEGGSESNVDQLHAQTNALLDMVGLRRIMHGLGSGRVRVALIDGPVLTSHSAFADSRIVSIGELNGTCRHPESGACSHGTFAAGILTGSRESPAPALAPASPLLVRPLFAEDAAGVPRASASELAEAIVESVAAGASVVNVSAAVSPVWPRGDRRLEQAVDTAAAKGVAVVVASGNKPGVGSSVLTRHPWPLSVVGFDLQSRPLATSTFSLSTARRGVGAPGEGVVSADVGGGYSARSGASYATVIVTGALALLASRYPDVSATELVHSLRAPRKRPTTLAPALLDVSHTLATLDRLRQSRTPWSEPT